MQVSAEVRWFGEGSMPPALRGWFHAGPFPVGGGVVRWDGYLRDENQPELGIKIRNGGEPKWDGGRTEPVVHRGKKPEVKGLVDVLDEPLSFGRATAQVQLWTKWKSEELVLEEPLVWLEKTRELRKFVVAGDDVREIELGAGSSGEEPKHESPPDVGCNVELTRVRTAASLAWTLGFESFAFRSAGRQTALVESCLRRVVGVLARSGPADLGSAVALSYPQWIATLSGSAR